MAAVVIVVAILTYRLIVLGTCAYAVFWKDYSGWWFLLAVLLCGWSSDDEKKDAAK